MTLSKEQIEAKKTPNGYFISIFDPDKDAICQQALRAIELERELITQKAAHSKLLRDEADRCAKHSLPESYKFLRRLADKIEKEE